MVSIPSKSGPYMEESGFHLLALDAGAKKRLFFPVDKLSNLFKHLPGAQSIFNMVSP